MIDCRLAHFIKKLNLKYKNNTTKKLDKDKPVVVVVVGPATKTETMFDIGDSLTDPSTAVTPK